MGLGLGLGLGFESIKHHVEHGEALIVIPLHRLHRLLAVTSHLVKGQGWGWGRAGVGV